MEIINHNPESIYKFSFEQIMDWKYEKKPKKKKVIMKLLIFFYVNLLLSRIILRKLYSGSSGGFKDTYQETHWDCV